MASQTVKFYLRAWSSDSSKSFAVDQKTINFESKNFAFHRVFSTENSQNDLFEEFGKPLVDNIMRGTNGILLAYGPSGSGKSFSLLGEPGEEGIIIRTLEEIFLRAGFLKGKKNIGIVLSFFEVDNGRIRDLSKIVSDGRQRMKEEFLEIREHQGNVYIDSLTVTQVESFKDAMQMIAEGKRLRKVPDLKLGNQSLVHNILKITVSQKDLNISKAGTLTIVDLADSDSAENDINKSLESLKNLLIDLQQGHHASSDESTLTKVLSNNLKNNCLTSVLFHIHAGDDRQTLNTLKYSNSCYASAEVSNTENNLFKSYQKTGRIRKLQDEISDLKHHIDKTQELHEGKLRSFGEILGLNLDIESVINASPGSKERKIIENHIFSIETLGEFENRNKKLEKKLQKNAKLFEEIQKFEILNKEKNSNYLKSLENQIKDFKIQIIELNEKIQESIRKQINTQKDELQRVLVSKHMEIEEKAAVIHNLPYTLQSLASDMRAITDYKEMGKAEADFELSKKFLANEESHKKAIFRLQNEANSKLFNFDSETRRFELECSNYLREKLEKIRKIETECIGCYETYIQQDKLIKDIENGVFNNGIKPVYMTVHDYPKPPMREKYP